MTAVTLLWITPFTMLLKPNLTIVVESKNIIETADGAEADGVKLEIHSLVFMNMWGLISSFLKTLEQGFTEFFQKKVLGNPLKTEYLISTFIGELVAQGVGGRA